MASKISRALCAQNPPSTNPRSATVHATLCLESYTCLATSLVTIESTLWKQLVFMGALIRVNMVVIIHGNFVYYFCIGWFIPYLSLWMEVDCLIEDSRLVAIV